MRESLTATQLSILRCPRQGSRLYVAVHRPQTLFSARLSAAPTTYPAASLAFSSGTHASGTVPAGTTLYIGSSAGARDKGQVRVRSALTLGATGTIAIAEIGEKLIDLAVNDYLTVVEDYRPAPKFPRYSGGAWYMDYDVAYDASVSKQNDNYGPLARLGPAACGFVVGGACRMRYVGERSAAYSPSNALDTWAWTFPDGSSSASEGTTASPVAVNYAAAIPNGEYHSLTVAEDATHKTHTGYRLTFVFERTGANAPYDAVILGNINGGPRQGGYTVDLRVINTTADQADFPDGAHVVVFEEAYYADDFGPWYEIADIVDPGGLFAVGNPVNGATSLASGVIVAIGNGYIHLAVTSGEFIPGELIVDDLAASASAHIYAPSIGGNYPYRSNVLLEGWIVAETVRKNPFTGSLDLTVTTLDGVLRTIENYPVALTNRSTTPALDWESYKRTTMNTATLHFVLWRSTIAAIADVEFQEYGPPHTAIMKYVTLDKADLFEQINGFWRRTVLGWVTCDLQGALYCEMDAVIDETVRAQVPTIWTVAKATDLRDELEISPRIIKTNSQTVLYAVAYRKPLGSKSPGDPHGEAGTTLEITDGVAGPLVGGDVTQPDQSTLNVWAGNLRAQANNRYPDVPHPLAGNWRIDPVPQSYFIESFAAGDTVRGFTLTAQKWLPRALRLAYAARAYALLADVTADAETVGLGGVAINFPPAEQPVDLPILPPVDDPPINPGLESDAREMWLFTTTGLYWSSDFFAGGQPTWNAVAGGYPASPGTLEYAGITIDGSTVYVVYHNGYVNYGIFKCTNPKSATPTWTDILAGAGPSAGVARYSGTQRACGIQGNQFWVFCNSTGIWYHRGVYNGTAWSWSNELTGLCATTDGWYGPRSFYRINREAEIDDISSGVGWSIVRNPTDGAGGSIWSYSATSHVTISGTDYTYSTGILQLADTGAVIAILSDLTGSLSRFDVTLNGSYEGNKVFAIHTQPSVGAARGRMWIGDTSGVTLKDTWTYAQRIHDAKRGGGGALVVGVSSCPASNEFMRISRDGTGDPASWESMTGNFWSLASGDQTFLNSQVVF